MTYQVEVTTAAAKAIVKLQRPDQRRVKRVLEGLADEPRPHGVEKMSGFADHYRVRAGNFRVVYTIDDTVRVVSVVRVAHRREVYRRLR